MSFFEQLEMLPEDPILGLPLAFAADQRPNKVNLGVGSYRTAEGKPAVMTAVKKAEEFVLQQNFNKEYLAIDGHKNYVDESFKLIFGEDSSLISSEELFGAQCVGGTGALRIGGELLTLEISNKTIFIPTPTWQNHTQLFKRAGLKVELYPYFDRVTRGLDFSGIRAAIQQMIPRSILLLHTCCHNPTGVDPTKEQWKELAELIQKQQLIPFFDCAYQGFGGSLDEDAWPIRHFASLGMEFLVAYSNSKNFGLYCDRLGLLAVVTRNKEIAKKVGSNVKRLIRSNYSTPPAHGARIVSAILQSKDLKGEWRQELHSMCERIQAMRHAIVTGLLSRSKSIDFSFMNDQKGIFSYTCLSQDQVQQLRQEQGIYMPNDGRINVAGLNRSNIDYVIEAILSVLK